MSDKTKKEWRVGSYHPSSLLRGTGCYIAHEDGNEDEFIFDCYGTKMEADDTARQMVAEHNAIVRAGIDWRKLEEEPDVLKGAIEAFKTTVRRCGIGMKGECYICGASRSALDRLGVKIHNPGSGESPTEP